MEGYVRRVWRNQKVDKVSMVKKRGIPVDMNMEKEEIRVVPIWVQLKLNFKYWGEKSLFKIVQQIGTPIKRDQATANRDKIYCQMVGHVAADCRKGGVRRRWVQKTTQPVVQPVTKPTVTEPEVDQEGFQRALKPIRVRSSPVVPTQIVNSYGVLTEQDQIGDTLVGLAGGEVVLQVKYGVGLVGLLEHKVKGANLGTLYQRSIFAYLVAPISGKPSFHCTFIYAFNTSVQRKELWRDLKAIKVLGPWILCGDLNCVMSADERVGSIVRKAEVEEIVDCMQECGMNDIKCVGNLFTWNNKQQGAARVFSKLDRIMGNVAWQNVYSSAEVCFMSEGQYDHCPSLLTVLPGVVVGKKPFKYFTMWKNSLVFQDSVSAPWNTTFVGSKMYIVTRKLKRVKSILKELNRVGFSDIQAAELSAYQTMLSAQEAMHHNPNDQELADQELLATNEYRIKHKAYLEFLKQKAKADWIKSGDENTALFHQSIKSRNVQNQVYTIHDMNGEWKDDPVAVSDDFVSYCKSLLGTTHVQRKSVIQQVVQVGPVCSGDHKAILSAPYTAEEVKEALFSIKGDKAPGPDGFGSHFYRDEWQVVGVDVTDAVLDVLHFGNLLKEVNHTAITLIPKTKCPRNVSDFRPISCSNTLYKCITKVLCGRLRRVLPDLILENQGGFVHGRFIVHNIMVVQDLVRQCGRKSVKPSCLMKIDLQKAYDTVDWDFLKEMLVCLEFPDQFIKLVMECVTTPMFSLMINGSMQGFFKSNRGLRQGDPMSPLLFVICMEYLSRVLQKMSGLQHFQYHPRCGQLQLTHLCFADDLILCCKGDFPSIYLLLQAFKLFSDSSGLQANKAKSSIYCYGMPENVVKRVLEVSGFSRSSLPFQHLGVPISSKRISAAQCGVLVEKMTARIRIWSFRNLSYTARDQLINSVLMSLHMYWAQIYILPKCVLNVLLWNVANIGKYVWSLATNQVNVWTKWVTSMYLKDGYSVKQVYDKLVGSKPKVHWDNMVWNRLSTPKHRFICWLAVQQRLQTTAKLASIGVSSSSDCLLCGQGIENHDHLFFSCPFSSRCLAELKIWLGIQLPVCNLQQLIKKIGCSKHSKFRKQVIFAGMAASVYTIWKSRNDSFWNGVVPTVQHFVSRLKQIVRSRIYMVMPKSISRRDSQWFLTL
ncbi:uncharacterized protein [Spinacia oleracea]|uniref:Reverse transcriptase domain-containing protein n=1 Tax=Spinacia oleracea TaxID=3562 RepID=A0ABM3QQ14_SPIOL|nr:uncharacterized protein LOC110776532 [Spinacia oleracea]